MLVASLLFSVMNACVFAIARVDPQLPAPVVSFVRIVVNLLILVLPAAFARQTLTLFGDRRPSLWLRGLFGSVALMLSFAAIGRIGPGESAFLTASSGVFVALLSPLILGQKNSLSAWLAILGAFAGVSLLFDTQAQVNDLLGRGMALAAGLLSALAYLMVAKAGRSNSASSVIFYFCLVGILIHFGYFAWYGWRIPMHGTVWALLLLASAAGSGAQFYMTKAYQAAPAALVSAVGYLAPVLSLVWGVALFGQVPELSALLGSALILFFGVLLPFLR